MQMQMNKPVLKFTSNTALKESRNPAWTLRKKTYDTKVFIKKCGQKIKQLQTWPFLAKRENRTINTIFVNKAKATITKLHEFYNTLRWIMVHIVNISKSEFDWSPNMWKYMLLQFTMKSCDYDNYYGHTVLLSLLLKSHCSDSPIIKVALSQHPCY